MRMDLIQPFINSADAVLAQGLESPISIENLSMEEEISPATSHGQDGHATRGRLRAPLPQNRTTTHNPTLPEICAVMMSKGWMG